MYIGRVDKVVLDQSNQHNNLLDQSGTISTIGTQNTRRRTIKELKLFHLKIFDCGSYVHISDHGINKFDSKSIKCSFISYGANDFGYKFGITRIRM